MSLVPSLLSNAVLIFGKGVAPAVDTPGAHYTKASVISLWKAYRKIRDIFYQHKHS